MSPLPDSNEPDSVQVAPGVIITAPEGRRVRRVIHLEDSKEADWLALADEVKAIRSDLAALRRRIEDVGRKETFFHFDSVALKVAGSLTLSTMALYELVDEGRRSFQARAKYARELWDDIERDPDGYVLEPGTSREASDLRNARGRIERAERDAKSREQA